MNGFRRLPGRTAALTVLAGCACLVAPAAAGATTTVFTSTGAEQTFTVPVGVTSLYVVAVGAPGGQGGGASGGVGGKGARVGADVSVTPGSVLYVEVGGAGGVGAANNGTGGTGGFNGGGTGPAPALGNGGGGGGGASDVRTISAVPSDSTVSLESRLIVAGGGGGGGAESNLAGGSGGSAGQPGAPNPSSCPVGTPCGGGAGEASSGGAGGMSQPVECTTDGQSGQLGVGGNGGSANNLGCDPGGGGGGGLYGGGGGGGAADPQEAGGGGGGSSGFVTGTSNTSVAADTTGTPLISITYLPTLTVTKAGTGKGTVTSSPAGINCGTACQHSFQAGAVVTLSAKPATGSRFAGWTGSCHGTGTCKLTMNSNASARATFTAIPPPNTAITGQQIRGAKRTATFEFRGTGGTGTLRFQCKLDSFAWSACTSPHTYKHLRRGSHTFRVRAVDARGKADPTPAKRTFLI